MAVLYVVIGVIILFSPLIFDLYVYYDKESKRLNFGLYIFNFIKVLGGFIQRQDKGIILHYKNKKAKIFNTKDMGKVKFKLKDLSMIEVFESNLLISLPINETNLNLASCLNFTSNFIGPIIKEKKDFLDLKTNVYLGCDRQAKIYFQLKFAFNIFTLILLLIRVLVRKWKKGIVKQ